MQDQRISKAAELFRRAWDLDASLELVRKRLPEPNMPIRAPLPPDWTELRSYAECARVLHTELNSALLRIDSGAVYRRAPARQPALDDPVTRTAELFHEAHRLLDDLADLQRRLPVPASPTPAELRDYPVLVSILHMAIRQGLWNAAKGAEFRNEFEVLKTLAPPQFHLDGPAWLRWLDEQMGPEPGR
jgi:hypothetical protein